MDKGVQMDVTEVEVKMQRRISATVKLFCDIWSTTGIGTDSQISKMNVMDQHLTTLLDRMLSEEMGSLNELKDTIGKLNIQLEKLCSELGSPFCRMEPEFSLLHLKEDLEQKVTELLIERKSRILKLRTLVTDEGVLCKKLNIPAKTTGYDSVPTVKQLEDLQLQVKNTEAEVFARLMTLKRIKHDSLLLLKELDLEPATDFERAVVYEEVNAFVLSDVNMENLSKYYEKLCMQKSQARQYSDKLKEEISSLWDQLCIAEMHREEFLRAYAGCNPKTINTLLEELTRCKQLRIDSLSRITKEAKEELEKLWKLCYYSQKQMEEFRPFYNDVVSEENLHLIDVDICHLRQLYEQKKSLYDKVKQREQLWSRFLELEQSTSDPARFNNRGGNLLKEERKRLKLTNELVEMKKQIIVEIQAWEASSGSSFLVDGLTFEDYVKKQCDEYKAEKDSKKQMRHLQKETALCSKPKASQLKRRLNISTSHDVSVAAWKCRRVALKENSNNPNSTIMKQD